jgi:hypothetical protein
VSDRRQLDWRVAISNSGLDGTAKLVAFVLDTWMNSSGFAWPAVETIANRCDLHERTVQRAIRRLEQAGLLLVVYSPGRTSNRYQAVSANPGTRAGVTSEPTLAGVPPQPWQRSAPTLAGAPPKAVKKPSKKPLRRGAGAPAHAEVHVNELVKFYVDRARARGVKKVPAKRCARVGHELKQLAGEGVPREVLEAALQRMVDRNLGPSLLPDLVIDVQSPPAVPREQVEHPSSAAFRRAGVDIHRILEEGGKP